MPNVQELELAVVRVFGGRALARAHRVAPDEQLLLGNDVATLLDEASDAPLAVDATDAFATFALTGLGVEDIFARLSAIPLPPKRPVFLQGEVAHVPAKVLAFDGELHILVPSVLRHHLRECLLLRGAAI